MAYRYKLFAIVAGLALVADQVTKAIARANLTLRKTVTFIDGFWAWRLSENPGSAFGMFGGHPEMARIFLSLVGVGACVAIVLILRKSEDDQKWLTSALGLVAGGAIGNVVDRILFARVTDFVVWHYKKHEWPAFNIADAALVAGVLIMFLDVGRDQKRARERQKAREAREVR